MGHVAVFGNDFEALDGFFIADNVREEDRAVFLDPVGGGSLIISLGGKLYDEAIVRMHKPWELVGGNGGRGRYFGRLDLGGFSGHRK